MSFEPSLIDAARLALQCLDLTSLNDTDSPKDIDALCQRAQSVYGPVAAVCVWPRFVAQARQALPRSIQVAAVANFPAGALDAANTLADIRTIADAGGDEVDVVLPYRALAQGQHAAVADFLAQVRAAATGLTLKVIIESGELKSPTLIADATQLALAAGADFVKTSTGKTPQSATLDAAAVMLQQIADGKHASAGFKASGGIRSVVEAKAYLEMAGEILGQDALTPRRFRFGASGLLNDIESVLAGQSSSQIQSAY